MLKKVLFQELAVVLISSVTRVISACSFMANLKKMYVCTYLSICLSIYIHTCVCI